MTIPTTDPDLAQALTQALTQALAQAAELRREQLRGLPDTTDDLVVTAQQQALTRTIDEIAAAQQRLADGTFGSCARCRRPIAEERLELRPWVTTCVDCDAR